MNLGADNSCLVSFYFPNGSAFQVVLRYQSEEQAKTGYQNAINRISAFDDITRNEDYKGSAEEYYFACSIEDKIDMCKYIGQYERYVIIFHTHMNDEYMTDKDLESTINHIDRLLIIN